MATLWIAVGLTAASLLHLFTVSIPEPEVLHSDELPKAVDFRGAFRAVAAELAGQGVLDQRRRTGLVVVQRGADDGCLVSDAEGVGEAAGDRLGHVRTP